MTGAAATAFVVALAVCLVATPLARRLALRLGVLDVPSERKSHAAPVPVLGGAALLAAFAGGVAAAHGGPAIATPSSETLAIATGAAVMACIGLRDDVRPLPAGPRVLLGTAVAAALYAEGVRADLAAAWPVDLVVTVAWIVGVTNAVNYLDNMDGLSAGVTAVAAASLCLLATWSGGGGEAAVLAAALAGAALGFLVFNRPPARIFMGDAGSLFLGFVLAAVSLQLHFDRLGRLSLVVAAVVLAVPLVDAAVVSLLRWRAGIPVLQAGRDHLSHRLAVRGLPAGAVVGVLCAAGAAGAALGWAIAYGPLGPG